MLNHSKPGTVALLIIGTLLTLCTVSLADIKKHVKGAIKDRVYTSPEKDLDDFLAGFETLNAGNPAK